MMKPTILSVAALLAAAIVLAGCGGSTSASGTTSGVRGAHHAHAGGNFSASVHGFEAKLQTGVQAFQKGNIASAASTAGPLLASCASTVNDKLAPQAATSAQKRAVTHLRVACRDMSSAARTGMSGNLRKAKHLAKSALEQSHLAVSLSR